MADHTFQISSGQAFDIQTRTAEVVAKENLKSFNFSQSGGGGYVGQYGGYIDAPKIHAHENNTDRIWLRDRQGNEFNLDITNMDLPVREGQSIKQFFVGTDGTDQSRRVGILNENTGQYLDLAHNSQFIVERAKNWKSPFSAKLCFFATACLLATWAYLSFFVNPEVVREKPLPQYSCLSVIDPAPMKRPGVSAAQHRAALEAHTAQGRIKYAACVKDLNDKERLEHEANVRGQGKIIASIREYQRKGYPGLVPALGWTAAVFFFLGFFRRSTSRTAYADRLKNETAATIRKFMTA